jgi:hypothetical protein
VSLLGLRAISGMTITSLYCTRNFDNSAAMLRCSSSSELLLDAIVNMRSFAPVWVKGFVGGIYTDVRQFDWVLESITVLGHVVNTFSHIYYE